MSYFPPGYFAPGYFAPGYFPGTGGAVAPPATDLRASLRAHLAADPTIAGLCGARVRPLVAPDVDPMPSLGLTLVGTVEDDNLNGRAALGWSRVQVDCWAETLAEAVTLSRRVHTLLRHYAGVMHGTQVLWIWPDGQGDHPTPTLPGGDRPLYRVRRDYRIKHRL